MATRAPVDFPPAWSWLCDEAIPRYVKRVYSPRESWKDKPFGREDVSFFLKGLEELSELFTQERPRDLPAYFQHPKYRSSYLLYFLPLQAAKFVTLLQLHARAFQAAMAHGYETGTLRVADLGAGPGTASLALLLMALAEAVRTGEELPPRIELHWFDTNAAIMEDGRRLIEELAANFPRLRGRVSVETHVAPWWDFSRHAGDREFSLIFLGNVLNEASSSHALPSARGTPRAAERLPDESELSPDDEADLPSPESGRAGRGGGNWADLWARLFARARGGGVLLVEPALRSASQRLSRLRDELLAAKALPTDRLPFWGPCPHTGGCPLADGRDWCHFSFPAHIPGQWFREFSKGLSSERQWIKLAYLWIAAPTPSPAAAVASSAVASSAEKKPKLLQPAWPPRDARLVISDVLERAGEGTVLLCEPESPARFAVSPRAEIYRATGSDCLKIHLRNKGMPAGPSRGPAAFR